MTAGRWWISSPPARSATCTSVRWTCGRCASSKKQSRRPGPEEGPHHRPAVQPRRRHRPGTARNPSAEAVPVHPAAGFGQGAAATARLLRPDGRDGKRALDLGRRGLSGRFQDAQARQGRGRDQLWRGHWHRIVRADGRFNDPHAEFGLWNVNGTNLENYGVPPDVYVDNTPDDFLKGRDAQVEKAVEVLKEELAKKK